MSKKQTAVEWLINEIDMQYPHINIRWKELMIDKAKQMEAEQPIAFAQWMHDYKGDINKVEELFEQFKKK